MKPDWTFTTKTYDSWGGPVTRSQVTTSDGEIIFDIEDEKTARQIVQSVNMFPKLVEALEEIRDHVSLPSGTSTKTQRSMRNIVEDILSEANNPT